MVIFAIVSRNNVESVPSRWIKHELGAADFDLASCQISIKRYKTGLYRSDLLDIGTL